MQQAESITKVKRCFEGLTGKNEDGKKFVNLIDFEDWPKAGAKKRNSKIRRSTK